MTDSRENLLVRFRAKDTASGVTRQTLKALAKELGLNETQVIHLALSRLAAEVSPAYAPDDGPLTASQLAALRQDAAKHLPAGAKIGRETLCA